MRRALVLASLGLLLAGSVGLCLWVGQGSLEDPALRPTLLALRWSRLFASAVAGAALAVAGVVVQGVFRNPLVSPSILGTTAGANLGGQVALLFIASAHHALIPAEIALPLGCLLGAALALLILLLFCRSRSGTLMLILTGFILSSFFLALGGFITSVAQDRWDLGRAVVAFTLGGVGGTSARQTLAVTPLLAAGFLAVLGWSRSLDLFLSGEEEARALGLDVGQARRWVVVWVAVLTAAAIAVGGNVAFVGLLVPHVLRPFVGVGHRRLIPAAAVLGATFLVLCDTLVRALPTRSEIPLGVITGFVGAPLFLLLLARGQRRVDHG
jgi:iron complex transport system permease protein